MQTRVQGFNDIFEEFKPKVLRFVTHMVGEMDAEDLTQEIFIKVNRALPDFRGECKLSTWLYRIATNAALDRLRNQSYKQANQQKALVSTPDIPEDEIADRNIWTGEKIPVPETQVMRKEMSACVQEYVHKLPENFRTVLVLSEFEGLGNQEIADILGISVGTVKIRLHRARERLRKDLIETCPSYWVDENEFLPDLKNL